MSTNCSGARAGADVGCESGQQKGRNVQTTELTAQEPKAPPRSRKRRLFWIPIAIVLGISVLMSVWSPGASTEATHVFDTPPDRIVIEVDGAVEVRAGDDATVALTQERGWFGYADPRFETDGGEAKVTARCWGWWPVDAGCQNDAVVTVPATTEVVVRTEAGAIDAVGIEAGMDLQTSAGAIVVSEVSGSARLVTSAGRIEGTVNGGDIEARTSAGAIDLEVSGNAGVVVAESSAGDILLVVSGDATSIDAKTSAGGIEILVSDEVYAVDFDTGAGTVELDVRTDPRAERSITARSSAGGILISNLEP